MGAKVFARDIRARDMPHWPQQQSHALGAWGSNPSERAKQINDLLVAGLQGRGIG
jgi:hypothetical protein